jgi:hypothetical protein
MSDEIFVDRVDGSTVAFATQRVERHDKNAFSTEAVYGNTPDAQLRPITCGDFVDLDRLDNIIVYATSRLELVSWPIEHGDEHR